MKKDNLEDFFKESFEKFEPEVNAGVWTKIQKGLKAVGFGGLVKGLWSKVGSKAVIILSASAVVAIVTSIFLMHSEKKESENKSKALNPPPVIQPVPVVEDRNVSKSIEATKNVTEEKSATAPEKKLKVPESSSKTYVVEKHTEAKKLRSDSVKAAVLGDMSAYKSQGEFSPNGDGIDDIFIFQSKNIANMDISIFDQNANLVYGYKGIDGKWDGKNQKGDTVKEGTYFYMIFAKGLNGKQYEQKGRIRLNRK